MENKKKGPKWFHRIKYRNSISPSSLGLNLAPFDASLKKHHHIMQYMNTVVKRAHDAPKVAPLPHLDANGDIEEFCRNCPTSAMSRFQERDILNKVCSSLASTHPGLVQNIMEEARDQYLQITQHSGIEFKLHYIEKAYRILPYKHLGRTENYSIFLQRRREFQSKYVLHHLLIRRIQHECITNLRTKLFNLSFTNVLEPGELEEELTQYANEAEQYLLEFHRKIVMLVESERGNYSNACSGLFSVNISKSLSETLQHIANFTASKDQAPYLILNITFHNRLVLQPTANEIIDIYHRFILKIIGNAKQFDALGKLQNSQSANNHKKIHLCLTDDFVVSILEQISCNIRNKYQPIENYAKLLDDKFIDIYEELSFENSNILSTDLDFDEGCKRIKLFKSYLPTVAYIPDNAYFNIGQLILTKYRNTLNSILLKLIENIFNNISAQHRWESTDICEAFTIIQVRATQKPITTEEVIEIGKYMAVIKSDCLDELKERVVKSLEFLTKLIQLGPLKSSHLATNARAINWLDEILAILEENSISYEQLKFEAEEKLQKVVEDVNLDIQKVYPLLALLDSMDDISRVKEYLHSITLHMVKIRQVEKKIEWINSEEVSLSFPKSNYPEYEFLRNYIYPFYHLLKLCRNVQRNVSVWSHGQFEAIRYDNVKRSVESYTKELMSNQKMYRAKMRQAQDENISLRFKGTVDDPDVLNWPAPLKLCFKATQLIRDFEPLMGIIRIMCNEALMLRHWRKMSQVAGFDITPNAGSTLSKMSEMDLAPNMMKYEQISFSASKERQLLSSLVKMQSEWNSICFQTSLETGIRIIVHLDAIQSVAEDHIIKAINMLSSIFTRPHYEQVEHFYNRLLKIADTLRECKKIQFDLLHICPLFSCIQLTQQLQQESLLLREITQSHAFYMELLGKQPNVEHFVTNTNFLQHLLRNNQKFEIINVSLRAYFRKTRQLFGKLYFLSNKDLLKMLGLNQNPQLIQKHITKMYKEITDLLFNNNTIFGISSGNEIVKLNREVVCEGPVEKWLRDFDVSVKDTIRSLINEAFSDYNQKGVIEWLTKWPNQVAIAVAGMNFTLNGHCALNGQTWDKYDSLDDIMHFMLTEMDHNLRLKTRSIIILMMHYKAILNELTLKVSNERDFKWLAQLRFYFSINNTDLLVKMMRTTIEYGYEYTSSEQIIITPSTERCYRNLMVTYSHGMHSICQGVSQTGKTVTIKSLANALAIHCIFFHCSQSLELQELTNFIRGITYNNSWLCLEDFEKIKLEMTSIISQEVSLINNKLKTPYQNRYILNKCFICINVKRRVSLPETLKIMFRPVIMAAPDLRIIAEVALFACGFRSSKELANKLVTVHEICQDLLPQTHTFGVRTIKEILGKLETINAPFSNEVALIYNTIRLVNTAKLSHHDLELFEDILNRTFQPQETRELVAICDEEINSSCKNFNFINTNCFRRKINELQQMMERRNGIIMFGRAATGKTALTTVLQSVYPKNIQRQYINTKIFTIENMFGHMDEETKIWTDGVLTQLLRRKGEDWIILDGQFDLEFIDSFATILDDSRKLYLNSGEVLILSQSKSIIFEMEDLGSKSSPSIISRCGIVYVNDEVVGWKSLITVWFKSKMEWLADYEANIVILFEWIVPPCLQFIKEQCRELLALNEMIAVKTMIQLLEMWIIDAFDATSKKEEDFKNMSSWIQASIIQATIWGLGSSLDLISRLKFDEFFKQLWRGLNPSYPQPSSLEKIEVSIPVDGLICDHSYIYKQKGNWKFWPDVLKNEKIVESVFLTEMLIPTVESIRYLSMLQIHINHGYPILLVGPSGMGKTMLIGDFLVNKIDPLQFQAASITFSVNFTANDVQGLILSKLSKRSTGRFGPKTGNNCVLFIDDFNAPEIESPVELIRALLDHNNWFNLETIDPVYIDNMNIIGAITANDSHFKLSQRLLRHFNVFSFNELHEDSIMRIFSNILLTKWKKIGFPSDILGTINQIVTSTYHFYANITNLKPCLTWNFYTFNMRHFSKAIQVISLIKKETADTNKKIFPKLWSHEILRVLGDKILKKDIPWIMENMKFCIEEHFKESVDILFENLPEEDQQFTAHSLSKLLFGTYQDINMNRFDETDFFKLQEIAINSLQNSLQNYIVLFDYALEHLSKICRILAVPCTNLLQVGTYGSGRETLVKIACAIYNQKYFTLQIIKNHTNQKWRNTVKECLKEAGGLGKPCTFFISENQLIEDSIFGDIDQLLKIHEIPNIYSLEEKLKILDLVRDLMLQDNICNNEDNVESILLYYKKKCKENVHIVLSFNSSSNSFKKHLRKYSSIRKFCEIEIYHNWPKTALQSVANSYIKDIEIEIEIKEKIINLIRLFHKEAVIQSRSIPVSTGSYLEILRVYSFVITQQQTIITKTKERYLTALGKLSCAATQIAQMQQSLIEYQPQLEELTNKAIEMAKEIELETIEVEKVSNLVRKDEEIANIQAADAQMLKQDCEVDLAQAIPILEDAISALNTLKPTDITLVKSMKNPPDAIKLVMAAVCVIKDVKPDRIPDPSTGRKTLDYWGPSKRILGDMNFLQTLKDFDKDNIKPEIMVKIRKDYLPHKDFKPYTVAKASSAAEGLCKWIIAMDMYDKVAKEVAPKKEKLEKAEREYASTMSNLNEKKEQVARIEQRLADLKTLLREATRKQQKLQTNVDLCIKRLTRAQKLIEGLSDDKSRWTLAVERLEERLRFLAGDALIFSGSVAYLGPLQGNSRLEITKNWLVIIKSQNIPHHDFDITKLFESELDYRYWYLNGLPINQYFLHNAIIGKFCKRWPLYIDPQNQITRWIKNIEQYNGIHVTKLYSKDFYEELKVCVSTGKPLLVENMNEHIPKYLNNLISRNIHIENAFMDLGGEAVSYNENFRIYFTTNQKYPKFGLEIYNRMTVINATMAEDALNEHFITYITEVEKPSLKKTKRDLNSQNTKCRDTLHNIEDKILTTLSESNIDILEDEQALQVLNDSKILSLKVQKQLEDTKELQTIVDDYRTKYNTVAIHASVLFLTLSALSRINHMYQFSLDWFTDMCIESIQKAHKNRDLNQRLKNLKGTITFEIYSKVSRSLFEDHKILFAFLIAINLKLTTGEVTKEELDFLISPLTGDSNGPSWLPSSCWKKICGLSEIPPYCKLKEDSLHLKILYESIEPYKENVSELFGTAFRKLMIISILRPEEFHNSVKYFIKESLGDEFIKPPSFDMCVSFMESHILSPLILILTPETNPVEALIQLAKRKRFENKLLFVPPQMSKKEEMFAFLYRGQKEGLWICFQNCHFMVDELPYLDQSLESLDYDNTHENFRLWFTTEATPEFPISLLERSVKIIKEPPRTVKGKLLYLFADNPINDDDFYNNCAGKEDSFVRLLYRIAFFHCVLQERRQFLPYSWKAPYEFNQSDFNFSIHSLQTVINSGNHSLQELVYLIKDCNYSGRIGDKFDNQLLEVLLIEFLNYQTPMKTDKLDCITHILKLEDQDDPLIFGLQSHYQTIPKTRDSLQILESIKAFFSNEIEISDFMQVCSILKDTLTKLPMNLKQETASADPLIGSVIIDELKNHNQLLLIIRSSLQDLDTTIRESRILDETLEALCKSLVNYQVPTNWMAKSSNNLSIYLNNVALRVKFWESFPKNPSSNVWLGCFFKPRAFLLASNLSYCCASSISINDNYIHLHAQDHFREGAILIDGLYLIGAHWNNEEQRLDEPLTKVLESALSTIAFLFDGYCETSYECPLYKDTLTLADSHNYINSIFVKSAKSQSYCIKRGVALFCQL